MGKLFMLEYIDIYASREANFEVTIVYPQIYSEETMALKKQEILADYNKRYAEKATVLKKGLEKLEEIYSFADEENVIKFPKCSKELLNLAYKCDIYSIGFGDTEYHLYPKDKAREIIAESLQKYNKKVVWKNFDSTRPWKTNDIEYRFIEVEPILTSEDFYKSKK